MSRRRCCFLSMDDMGSYVSDDELAIGPLGELGWDVSTISWRKLSVDWNDFDIVVIRTTWDYQREPELFLEILGRIDASEAQLENPLDIVRWNLDKRYLRELEMRGVCIVPTIWDARYDEASFDGWLKRFATDELIIKPTVSATAEHTYRLRAFDPSLKEVFRERQFMVQPFMHGIVDEGEFSLFYFNGEYSHAILKAPKTKDFRVQEEHGGIITAVESTIEMRSAAESALRQVGQSLLYARIDLVRDENEFRLMELELIEPALYLRMDAGAPERFASAIDALMNRSKSYDGAKLSKFWSVFCEDAGVNVDEPYQVWYFGNTREMAFELVRLVIAGTKTATASLAAVNEIRPTEAPIADGYSIVTDFDGSPMCVIQTTEIRHMPFAEVDAEFAFDEGEGDRSLEYWRDVHLHYFEREAKALGIHFDDRSIVCCERFRSLFPR